MASHETQHALGNLWRRGQRGWPATFPVAQLPNAPLLLALAGLLVAGLTSGSVHDYGRGAFYAGLAAWSWEELASGANWLRRALGVAGIVFVVGKLGMLMSA
jgi:hypothetical protein